MHLRCALWSLDMSLPRSPMRPRMILIMCGVCVCVCVHARMFTCMNPPCTNAQMRIQDHHAPCRTIMHLNGRHSKPVAQAAVAMA